MRKDARIINPRVKFLLLENCIQWYLWPKDTKYGKSAGIYNDTKQRLVFCY